MKSDGFEVFAPAEPYLLKAGEAARRSRLSAKITLSLLERL